MGREVRMVPPNWEHPRHTAEDAPHPTRVGDYKSLHGEFIDEVFAKWLVDFDRVRLGEDLTEFERKWYPRGLLDWLVDHKAPDPADYVTYTKAEATWVQVYETVSEGTPVTPPFATKGELIDYLTTHGDDVGSRHVRGPWDRERALKFVESGWAPSMIVMRSPAKTTIETAGHVETINHAGA